MDTRAEVQRWLERAAWEQVSRVFLEPKLSGTILWFYRQDGWERMHEYPQELGNQPVYWFLEHAGIDRETARASLQHTQLFTQGCPFGVAFEACYVTNQSPFGELQLGVEMRLHHDRRTQELEELTQEPGPPAFGIAYDSTGQWLAVLEESPSGQVRIRVGECAAESSLALKSLTWGGTQYLAAVHEDGVVVYAWTDRQLREYTRIRQPECLGALFTRQGLMLLHEGGISQAERLFPGARHPRPELASCLMTPAGNSALGVLHGALWCGGWSYHCKSAVQAVVYYPGSDDQIYVTGHADGTLTVWNGRCQSGASVKSGLESISKLAVLHEDGSNLALLHGASLLVAAGGQELAVGPTIETVRRFPLDVQIVDLAASPTEPTLAVAHAKGISRYRITTRTDLKDSPLLPHLSYP